MRVANSVLAIALTLLFTGLQAVNAERAEGSFERTLTVSGPVQLQVSTGAGNITIHKGGAGSVRIQAQIRANERWGDAAALVREIEQNPPVRQTGNIISVGSEVRRWNNVSISYDIVAPEQTQANARTGSGGVSVYDLHGPLDASTGAGSIRAENIGSRVEAKTGSGGITIGRAGGDARASTGSGTVDLSDINGAADAQTGSGNITVSGATGRVRAHAASGRVRVAKARSDVDAHSASGGIEVDGTPKSSRWELRTSSGSVNVSLPVGTGFELDAHASSGHISTTHQVTVSGVIGKHELRGVAGRPDNHIIVRTTSGNIRID